MSLLLTQSVLCQFGSKDSLQLKLRAFEKQQGFQTKDTSYIKLLNELGRSYIFTDNDSLLLYSEKALELSVALNYPKGQAAAKSNFALFENFKGNYEKTIKLANEAKILALEAKADTIYFQSINISGLAQFRIAAYDRAYLTLMEGVDYSKKVNATYYQIIFLTNVGQLFLLNKDYEQSLEYYKNGLDILVPNKYPVLETGIQASLGELYLKLNDYKNAKYYANKSLQYSEENNLMQFIVSCMNVKGGVALKENKLENALHYYKRAEKIVANLNDQVTSIDTKLNLSELYFLKDDIAQSEKHCLLAKEAAHANNYHDGIIRACEILSNINKTKNKPFEVIKYQEKAKKIADSLAKRYNKEQMLLLEAKFRFDQQKDDIISANKRKIEQQKIITYVTSMGIVLLGIILFLIRKNVKAEKKTSRKLKEINNAKDKIFGIVGHDLKAPISTLQELLSLYDDKAITTKKFKELTPRIKKNVDYSQFTLNNLLVWAQTQMGGAKKNPKSVNLFQSSEKAILLYDELVSKKSIKIENLIEKNASAYVDTEHLGIIFRNLFHNAIKFTPENGMVTLSSKESDSRVEITVCDNGKGMSKETIKDILSKEYIQSTRGTNSEKGTGLGMTICMELLEVNGGTMKIESSVNEGSCFHIFLPNR